MSWSDLASIATLVQAFAVIVSLIFVWFQLRQTTQLTRAANTEKLVELVSPLHLQLAQDRETARLWLKGAVEFDAMDEVDQERW